MAMATATLLSRPIAIAAMVILARLLDPADFGTIALATVLFGTAQLFSGLGMDNAVIQSVRSPEEIGFQAFFVTIVSSLSLFLLVNLNVEFFAALLGDVEMVPILHWMSLLLILNTLTLVPEALIRREMRFGKVSASMVLMNVITSTVSIVLALMGFGLWSLVWGQLAGSAARMLMIWFSTLGWYWLRPQALHSSLMRELLRFGLKSTGGGFVNYINSHWDDWYVGRTMGTTALGYYDKAYNLTNATIAGLNTSILSGVLMPSYARLQSEPARLQRAYIKGLSLSAMLMAPLSMGVFAVAPELVNVLFGEKWIPMIPTLQIFAFMALARPLAASTSPLFQAVGKPEYDLQGGLVVLAAMVPMVLYMATWGIEGVAVAVVLSFVAGLIFNVYKLNGLLPGVARQMIPAVTPSLVSSALMVGAVAVTRQIVLRNVPDIREWVLLLVLIAAGGAVFVAASYLMQRTLIHELIDTLGEVLKGNRFIAAVSRRAPVKA